MGSDGGVAHAIDDGGEKVGQRSKRVVLAELHACVDPRLPVFRPRREILPVDGGFVGRVTVLNSLHRKRLLGFGEELG